MIGVARASLGLVQVLMLVLVLGSLGPAKAQAQTRVNVPSLEGEGVSPTLLPSVWFEAARDDMHPEGRAPALVLLHGCGGPYASETAARERRQLSQRMLSYAERLNRLGVHVLVTDSLTPRGERELCTQRYGQRRVTQRERRQDALGAVAWLAQHPRVDPARLGVMGWSNGGTTVLASTDATRADVRAQAALPSLAIAFYPGCNDARDSYRPMAPLLVLIGQADDWTPARPCVEMGERLARTDEVMPKVEVLTYAGAYHGFDGTGPVRLRKDVPNGTRPGQGVHAGGQPEARDAALKRVDAFIRERWFAPRQ